MRRLITQSILLACVALGLASTNSAVRGQGLSSGPASRSVLATLEEHETATVTVINAGDGPGVRVVAKILVWERTTDRTAIRYRVVETVSTGEVLLGPGEGISLDYTDAACKPNAECKSMSGLLELPDGHDPRIQSDVHVVKRPGPNRKEYRLAIKGTVEYIF